MKSCPELATIGNHLTVCRLPAPGLATCHTATPDLKNNQGRSGYAHDTAPLFLNLPVELRLIIYGHLVSDEPCDAWLQLSRSGGRCAIRRRFRKRKCDLSAIARIMRVNKQIHDEAEPLLYSHSLFKVSLDSDKPWIDAVGRNLTNTLQMTTTDRNARFLRDKCRGLVRSVEMSLDLDPSKAGNIDLFLAAKNQFPNLKKCVFEIVLPKKSTYQYEDQRLVQAVLDVSGIFRHVRELVWDTDRSWLDGKRNLHILEMCRKRIAGRAR